MTPFCEKNSGVCQNGGQCLDSGANYYRCDCPTGFTGRNCEVPTMKTEVATAETVETGNQLLLGIGVGIGSIFGFCVLIGLTGCYFMNRRNANRRYPCEPAESDFERGPNRSNRIEEEITPVYTPGKMPTGKNVTGKLDTTADSAIASSMNSTTSMNSTHMNSTIERNLTRSGQKNLTDGVQEEPPSYKEALNTTFPV